MEEGERSWRIGRGLRGGAVIVAAAVVVVVAGAGDELVGVVGRRERLGRRARICRQEGAWLWYRIMLCVQIEHLNNRRDCKGL